MIRKRTSLVLLCVVVASSRCDCGPEPIAEVRCEFELGSDTLDFGAVALGDRRTRSVVIRNTGTLHLSALQFDFSGTGGEHFELGAVVPIVHIGEEVSIPILFVPTVLSTNINHQARISHADLQNVPCSAHALGLRGAAYERPDLDAGVDAALDASVDALVADAFADATEDAGTDAGPLLPYADAGLALDAAARFVTIGGLQEARSHAAAAASQNAFVVVAGGYGSNGAALSSIEKVDVETGTGLVVAHFSSPRARLSATSSADNKVVFIGGIGPGPDDLAMPSAELATYFPQTDVVEVSAHAMRTPRFSHLAAWVGDAVLVAFGETRQAPGGPVIPVADPVLMYLDSRAPTDVTSVGVEAQQARAQATLTALGDGRVVFVGGRNAAGEALDSVLLYQNGSLSVSAARLEHARYGHAAAILDADSVLVVGGVDTQGQAVTTAELISTIDDATAWTVTTVRQNLGARVSPMAASLAPGVVLLAGGAVDDERQATEPQSALTSADLLIWIGGGLLVGAANNHLGMPRWQGSLVLVDDGAVLIGGSSTTWRRSPTPSVDRYRTSTSRFTAYGLLGSDSATLGLSTGAVLSIGGGDANLDRVSPRSRIYRVEDDSMVEGPQLLTPRRAHAVAEIAAGVVLVLGGYDVGDGVLRSCEIVDIDGSSSIVAANLQQARAQAQVMALENGAVLVCGGVGVHGVVLDSCELYQPGLTPLNTTDDVVGSVGNTMSSARVGHQINDLGNGFVLISGGVDPAQGRRADDVFDMATASLRPTLSLPHDARWQHTAVSIGIGRVLLIGGVTYNGAYVAADSAEIYDLSADVHIDLAAMHTSRVKPAALLLRGGAVLLSGGHTDADASLGRPHQALNSSELFDPELGIHGEFVAIDIPLRAPRASAAAFVVDGIGVVVGGNKRDGVLVGGAEQKTVRLTVERLLVESSQ